MLSGVGTSFRDLYAFTNGNGTGESGLCLGINARR
jgi:hypothetical protein